MANDGCDRMVDSYDGCEGLELGLTVWLTMGRVYEGSGGGVFEGVF